jgi:Uncharacterized protein conserved in bacteria (DUF2213)
MKHREVLKAYVLQPWKIENGQLKAPVTIAVEGVHFGSNGPIYWAGHILEENAHKWEGVPVSLDHPMAAGVPVSINHSSETRSSIIGLVKNPRFDPVKKAIKAEIHISANHPKAGAIQSIKEVSMGVFSDEIYTPGEFQGEQYSACSITMQPDHLALLPEDQGACSWGDGCGIRNNSQSKAFKEAVREAAQNHFKSLIQGGQTMYENEVKPLLPPGVGKKEEIDYSKNQEEADRRGVLLPTELNRNPETKNENWTGGADEIQPLLPPGMNR